MELIQIGAVVMAKDGTLINRFEAYARPSIHPKLTSFCTRLTGISQSRIDQAKPLSEVLVEFDKWVAGIHSDHLGHWGSWGAYDRNQFIKDARRQKVTLQILAQDSTHHNLKSIWAERARQRPMGLGKAVVAEGLRFEGRAHNALVDAENIARLKHIRNYRRELPY
ncbi:inhibitor of KinA sporulation pathway (predicted exonuclease) [Pseudomonas nitritireducens]|uniref:Inhibitor of KinA sporulation pathway (Predicted exonuclease) n=2 Tax=Pseudomonas nitroreducens TaxID=46680 RepID=A0A7W7KMV2_PSENT|nr:inhibitor of KinA sporulation pathway (predicted exonuclease) [Pseudomonas nitritireducens]